MGAQKLFARRLAVPFLVAALAGSACSMSSSSPAPRTGADIIVGIPNSATGSVSTEGGLARQGYDLWQDWANRSGGIEVQGVRHKVKLIYEDDQSQPQLSAQVAEKMLTEERAQFLLSPYGTTTTMAVAAVAEKHQVPMIDSNGAARQIFMQGYRYTFGVLAPADQYVQAGIDWELTLNPVPKTLAITTADDDASLFIAQAAAQISAQKGIKLVYMQKYPAGSTNLFALVQQAKAKNPDIFFNSGHFLEAVAAHNAAKNLGLNAKIFIYSVGPTQPQFTAALGPAANFVVTAAPWTAQAKFKATQGPSVVEYVQSYRQKFHTQDEPTFITADATAAGLALQFALEHAQSLVPARVRDAVASLDANTFYGRIKFDAQGENTFANALVLQIQNGQRETVYPPELASAQSNYPAPTWEARFGVAAQPPKAKLPVTGVPPGRR